VPGGWRGVRWFLAGAGLLFLAAVVLGIYPYNMNPNDSHAYWVVDAANPYRDAEVGRRDAFLYAPAVAQLLAPFTRLPFEVFRLGLGALDVVALTASGMLYTLLLPGVVEDIVRGNVHILLAVAIVVGFRAPGTWAAMLLTKVTPGVGLLWFAVRREWRALGWVLLTVLVVAGLSVGIGGIDLWREWIGLLVRLSDDPRSYTYLGIAPPPLVVRLPAAAAVVTWGALTDRRWVVPVAAFLGLPVIWPSGWALLAAVPPLWMADRARRNGHARAGTGSGGQ
jgi:hypothetical protein